MAVNVAHKQYEKFKLRWERCRDCVEGSDAVKDRGDRYLPPLDSHKAGDNAAYNAYKMRALFFNATGRTVSGLAGASFQKEPTIKFPKRVEKDARDVTLTGISAELFGLMTVYEVWTVGRWGALVDMAASG